MITYSCLGIDVTKNMQYYCSECLTRLNNPQQVTCSNNCSLNGKYRPFSNVSELALNDVRREIRYRIEMYASIMNDYRSKSTSVLPGDVMNGNVYRTMATSTSIKPDQNQVTIMLHTDGAPVTKFHSKSLWPIQGTFCEIPPPIRDHQKAVLMLGAWLGIHHPDRNLLWTTIVEEIRRLFEEEIVVKVNHRSMKFIVRVQFVIFDLPALAMNCNIIQYNGYHACPFCIIKGDCCEKQIVYPHSVCKYNSKTANDYIRHGSMNHSGVTTIGIKGPTPLMEILSLPVQICIDYMHLVCSGHVKTLIGYWHKMLLPSVFIQASDYVTSIILPHSFNYQFSPLLLYGTWKTKMFRSVFKISNQPFA